MFAMSIKCTVCGSNMDSSEDNSYYAFISNNLCKNRNCKAVIYYAYNNGLLYKASLLLTKYKIYYEPHYARIYDVNYTECTKVDFLVDLTLPIEDILRYILNFCNKIIENKCLM